MRVSVIWGATGLGAIAAIVALAHPWPLDERRVAERLNAAWPETASIRWRAPGAASLKLAPWPTLELTNIEVGGPGDLLRLSAPGATLSLSLADLAVGRLRPSGISVERPDASLDLDNRGADLGAAIESPEFPFGIFRFANGALHVRSAQRGLDFTISKLSGRLDWRSPGGPAIYAFESEWRGKSLISAGRLDAPLRFRKGGNSAASLSATGPFGEFSWSGDISKRGEGEFSGEVSARIPSVSGLAAWLGVRAPWVLASDAVALKAQAKGSPHALRLIDSRLSLGSQQLDGSLDFTLTDGKLSIAGTLAADKFDLGVALGPPPRLVDSSGHWSSTPLLPDPDPSMDLDLRLSATHVEWGALKLENAAFAVDQSGGKLAAKLLDATAYKGALAAQASVRGGQDPCEWEATASLENADIGALAKDLGIPAYAASGGIETSFAAKGRSPSEWIASARGTASLDQKDVVISGVDFEEALRRSQRRPLDTARDIWVGQAKFARARARLDIAGGEAAVTQGDARGPGAILTFGGAIGLSARDWRLRLTATQANSVGEPAPDASSLSLDLLGPWSAPSIVPALNGG